MSSTKRGGDRHAADYYVTPQWAIKAFLEAFKADMPELDADYPDLGLQGICDGIGAIILDPCAGGDETHWMAYPHAIEINGWPKIKTMRTVDLREDSRAEIKSDFLNWSDIAHHDIAITNPPFVIAQEVIDGCLKRVQTGGIVVMLLRLNFFGGAKRLSWWHKNMPVACYVHSKRIGFTDDGKTDSIEYMHAVWIVGEHPKFTKLRVI